MAVLGILVGAIVIGVYIIAAYAYVLSLVYAWTMAEVLGVQLSWSFFVGVMSMVGVLKSGLASSYDSSKEWTEIAGKLICYAIAPWLALLVVWVLVQ